VQYNHIVIKSLLLHSNTKTEISYLLNRYMSKTNLARLSGGADFVWHCLPPRGRSGGILLGVNASILDLSLIVEGEFFMKFHLCNKVDRFKWILMAVYGPAQDEFISSFLSELVQTCQQNSLLTLLVGILIS
jgi:hypothetical protein